MGLGFMLVFFEDFPASCRPARCAVLFGLLVLGYLAARGQAAGADTVKEHNLDAATLKARSTTGGDESPVSTDANQTGNQDEGWVEVGSDEGK